MDVRVSSSLVIPAAELRWQFSRSSGPGGQHVNTTDTQAELTWDATLSAVLTQSQRDRILIRFPTGVVSVRSSTHRSQLRNREEALEKLGAAVRSALAPPPRKRRKTRPSRASIRRQQQAKRHRSQIKALRRRPNQD